MESLSAHQVTQQHAMPWQASDGLPHDECVVALQEQHWCGQASIRLAYGMWSVFCFLLVLQPLYWAKHGTAGCCTLTAHVQPKKRSHRPNA